MRATTLVPWWGALTVAAALGWASDARAQCASDAECKGGRACRAGACVTPCETDNQCPGAQVCDNKQCVAPGQTGVVPGSPGPAQPPAQPPPWAAPGPGQPPPPWAAPAAGPRQVGERVEKQPIKGLAIAGGVVLGAVWLLTISITAAINVSLDSSRTEQNIGFSAIPVAGPMVILGTDSGADDYAPALIVSTVLQSSGLIMLVTGLSIRREKRIPVYATVGPVRPEGAKSALSIAPWAPPGSVGSGLKLSF